MPMVKQLAIDGGEPFRTAPFPPWPAFDDEMIEATAQVLRSGKVNYWTGQETRQFESEFADQCQSEFAIALANGTLSLELALQALGIGPGDEVVVPCRTFIATASAVVTRGAKPVVADVDPVTQNITAATIEDALSSRTRAVIPVHLAGLSCDMDPIMKLASDRGLYVVEDCAQAHGATYLGRPVGSIGHLGSFSFCQDKILTTGGEGGMLTTNDRELWKRAWAYKDHGKDWDAVNTPVPGAVFKWLHESFGTNWRMTEMQSAIGRVVLRRLPDWVEARRKNAAFLHERLQQLDGVTSYLPDEGFGHSYYKFYAQLDVERLSGEWTRDKVVKAMQAEGIPFGSGACSEIYKEGAFVKAGLAPDEPLPAAKALGETSMMFVVHPTLREAELDDTIGALEKVLRVAI